MNELLENPENLQKQISFVSHEIRNNISICDMYSQILRRKLEINGIKDDSLLNAINCIQKSIQLIGANLADLKALNNQTPKICNLEKITANAIDLSKAYINDKNIKYHMELFENVHIYTDENKLLSCIVNILKNGIEAIEKDGEINISLSVDNQNAVLQIGNNGNKIPENTKNKIFDYGYTTKESGSGFGLCLTKKYLESQNAQFNLLKSDDKETIFEIKIPIAAF